MIRPEQIARAELAAPGPPTLERAAEYAEAARKHNLHHPGTPVPWHIVDAMDLLLQFDRLV